MLKGVTIHNKSEKIVFMLNIICSIATLICYWSRYINPGNNWVLSLFSLAYPIIILFHTLFILFWLYRKKITILLSVVIIFLGGEMLTDFFQPYGKSEEVNSDHLNVMSYNVRGFNRYKWLDNKDIKKNIIKLINESNFDIVCLQEFFVNEKDKNNAVRKLDKHRYKHIYYTSIKKHLYYGVATYSRYPIISEGSIRFKGSNNVCIYIDVEKGDKIIRIYNMYLSSYKLESNDFDDTKDESKIYRLIRKIAIANRKRSNQVDKIMAHIKKCPYETVLCGDLNDIPSSFSYGSIKDQLVDAFVTSGSGIGSTYINFFPFFRIDYIFHSSRFRSVNYRRHDIEYSDHYPISCDILLNEN